MSKRIIVYIDKHANKLVESIVNNKDSPYSSKADYYRTAIDNLNHTNAMFTELDMRPTVKKAGSLKVTRRDIVEVFLTNNKPLSLQEIAIILDVDYSKKKKAMRKLIHNLSGMRILYGVGKKEYGTKTKNGVIQNRMVYHWSVNINKQYVIDQARILKKQGVKLNTQFPIEANI